MGGRVALSAVLVVFYCQVFFVNTSVSVNCWSYQRRMLLVERYV